MDAQKLTTPGTRGGRSHNGDALPHSRRQNRRRVRSVDPWRSERRGRVLSVAGRRRAALGAWRIQRRGAGEMMRSEFTIEDIARGRTMTITDLHDLGGQVFECNKVRRTAWSVPG